MNIKTAVANPFLKTVLSNVVGAATAAAVTTVDQVVTATPTGGFAAWLTTHPLAVPAYVFGAQYVHNLISHRIPPGEK